MSQCVLGGDAGADAFQRLYGVAPEVRADAPGRVNLLGEHTDYNEGYVLPTPLPYFVRVQAAKARDVVEAYSETYGERMARRPEAGPARTWLDYVAGCVWALRREGYAVRGARFHIGSGVPVGAGLASSAALEVAVMRALRTLYRLDIDDLALALLAHRAEVEYVGVRCGVMDQIVASLGRCGEALLLDTRTLTAEAIPIPPGCRFAVVDSGTPRRLAEAGYNLRRAECEQAAVRLGVRTLRDVRWDDLNRAAALPPPLNGRVRHVVTENGRVLAGAAALRSGEIVAFGELMTESHRSLRDDYGVSTQDLDRLVGLAIEHGALGARLTGAGFGGCIVALVPDDRHQTFVHGLGCDAPGATVYS